MPERREVGIGLDELDEDRCAVGQFSDLDELTGPLHLGRRMVVVERDEQAAEIGVEHRGHRSARFERAVRPGVDRVAAGTGDAAGPVRHLHDETGAELGILDVVVRRDVLRAAGEGSVAK